MATFDVGDPPGMPAGPADAQPDGPELPEVAPESPTVARGKYK